MMSQGKKHINLDNNYSDDVSGMYKKNENGKGYALQLPAPTVFPKVAVAKRLYGYILNLCFLTNM